MRGATVTTLLLRHILLCASATAESDNSCSPQKACDFVKELNVGEGGHGAKAGDKLSLMCTPAEKCQISGTALGGDAGLAATVAMANVLVANNAAGFGGLLGIGSGSFTGTNLTLRNGRALFGQGGCVFNGGTFACTDCVFDKCASGYTGGCVNSGCDYRDQGCNTTLPVATLKLVRPRFTGGSTCQGGNPCGAGCACWGENAADCVGCTCSKRSDGRNYFYCPNSEAADSKAALKGDDEGAAAAAAAAVAIATCADKIYNGSSIYQGSTLVASLNVSNEGACCTSCHSTYVSRCAARLPAPIRR